MDNGILRPASALASLFVLLVVSFSQVAQAQDQYIGEIRMFASNYCPRDWLEADGRLLPIDQYTALYALFGNLYGGDGRVQFGIPDLRGRVPVGRGMGPGLSDYRQGDRGGQESVTLNPQQMPEHSHAIMASQETGNNKAQVALGGQEAGESLTQPVQKSGEGWPHENRPPYQVIRFCIAVRGIFPQRD